MTEPAPELLDLVVIGGGVNGCGIARDAAGRGLKVLLAEKDDLAGATSSKATKLIHGGLRYLEYYEFRLVREALQERAVLLNLAPHIMWPLRFVLPHEPGVRPYWMIRAGLFLYDHLGGPGGLPGTEGIRLNRHPAGQPLKPKFDRGFVYSDGWVDDARLVALNAVDARQRGARVLTRTAVTAARRDQGKWQVQLHDRGTGLTRTVQARILVNAAGPWVRDVVTEVAGLNAANGVRQIKGSHIITRKLFDHPYAYIFQNADGRVIFAIPYETDFTLIGTTDIAVDGRPEDARITDDEIAYLAAAASDYFAQPIAPADVVSTYSGVRPLYDDGHSDPSAITRDYVLDLDTNGGAPLLSVYGGKLTTYRRLAEHALEKIERFIPQAGSAWTRGPKLPGGDLGGRSFDRFVADLARDHAAIDPLHLRRLARRHGARTIDLLGDARTAADLGRHFGAGLYEREIDWLKREEWAVAAEDVLWRRTKCGLRLNADEARAVAEFMGA